MTWYARPLTYDSFTMPLLVGKWHEVIEIEASGSESGYGFIIAYPDSPDSHNEALYCVEFGCAHLGGGDWELEERKDGKENDFIHTRW